MVSLPHLHNTEFDQDWQDLLISLHQLLSHGGQVLGKEDEKASFTIDQTLLACRNRLVLGNLPGNVSLAVTAALMAEYNAGM